MECNGRFDNRTQVSWWCCVGGVGMTKRGYSVWDVIDLVGLIEKKK